MASIMGRSMPDDFERMWSDLAPLGRSATSGGYFRQPFTSVDVELRSWFVEQAQARGLDVEGDAFGNLFAWWRATPGEPVRDALLTGSHLDSVLDGGAYDGPLGVVAAFAAIDVLRDRGFRPTRPIGVSMFAEEEGSRFGLACLGSRLATGVLPWARARELQDRDGVFLADALDTVPGLSAAAPGLLAEPSLNDRIGCFVELHVEQGRDLVDRGSAIGVGSEIWPHGRYRFDFTGAANHAGTTRMEDRRDPMLAYAMTALAANKQARLAGERATFGRLEVAPNGTNAIPSRVTAWLDARCSTEEALASLVDAITAQATDRAGRDGTVAGGHRRVGVRVGRLRPGPRRRDRPGPRGRRLAGDPDGRRARRGDPLRRGHPHGDAVRPQPDRRLALAVGARGDAGLPGGGLGARRHPGEAGDAVTGPASYLLERAWVDGAVRDDVLVEIEDGRFTSVGLVRENPDLSGRTPADKSGFPRSAGETRRLPGLTLPGLANCHSHAFHRALRGRTQRERGTFWTWREQMYAVAATLDPDSYFALARATYREMAAAGITTVGEFHYLHHQPDGTPYADPNAMGLALVEAAREAGIRIALLDTAYLSSGFGKPVEGPQVRYSDGDAGAWAERVGALDPGDGVVVGAAIHSVRAVPRDQLPVVVAAATGRPLHVHLSEQVAENEGCLAAYGVTPTRLLADAGALGATTSAVHATHLTADDVAAARGEPHPRLLLPDHRARPRRRHRAQPRPPRRGQPADAGLRQPRGDRPLRGDAGRRARRAAGHPATRPLDRGRAPGGRHHDRPRQPRLRRRRRDRRRAAGRPGDPGHEHAADRRHRPRPEHRGLRRHRRGRHAGDGRRPGRRAAG